MLGGDNGPSEEEGGPKGVPAAGSSTRARASEGGLGERGSGPTSSEDLSIRNADNVRRGRIFFRQHWVPVEGIDTSLSSCAPRELHPIRIMFEGALVPPLSGAGHGRGRGKKGALSESGQMCEGGARAKKL